MIVKNYKSTTLKGKLRVANYLQANAKLRLYVPVTVPFSYRNIRHMIQRFPSLYIKPNIGSQGIGIFKLMRVSGGYALESSAKEMKKPWHFTNLPTLFKHLKRKVNGRMIIQRGIKLDQFRGRPYDIRVMVQRKPGLSWTCTGFIVKVGAPRKIVTNYYQGGKLYTIQNFLKQKKISSVKSKARIQYLSRTAEDISRVLSKKKSGMHEMGIDLAYDHKKRLWVLEVNSNHPEFYPLRWLDRSAFNRMLSYARSYGRLK